MLVVPVANLTSVLMPVVVLVANILMPDPRQPNPPYPLHSSSWSLEVRQPTKLYLLQEISVIVGQKKSIQQSFIFCKKVQFLEFQADAIYMKLEFHFQIPFVLLCKDILGTPFEVVPYTEEPFSNHWWTLHPPQILWSLFNVPPTPH